VILPYQIITELRKPNQMSHPKEAMHFLRKEPKQQDKQSSEADKV
jgi:hypothetical protein